MVFGGCHAVRETARPFSSINGVAVRLHTGFYPACRLRAGKAPAAGSGHGGTNRDPTSQNVFVATNHFPYTARTTSFFVHFQRRFA